MVNRACADAATRPAAIAVELDPAAAAAVAGWLGELGVAPGEAPLPCMLGLARQNRRIHPRFKAAALRLQQTTGRQLHELAPDLLYRELGYAPVGLLCLSPTDSIIEAIRCALELKAPLYGIDLDDPAAPAQRPARHQRDPLAARGDLAAYLRALGRQADQARDEHTDGRRELVMAARLKALLMRHDRVLFTGGLGHWASLCRLLADDGLAPAREVPQDGPVGYQRVLVHPRQALAHMDLFPRLTAAYEAARQPVTRDRAPPRGPGLPGPVSPLPGDGVPALCREPPGPPRATMAWSATPSTCSMSACSRSAWCRTSPPRSPRPAA